MLWPDEEVQCIVSVGNGRYEPSSHTHSQDSVSSLKHKLGTIIHSATNTEGEHAMNLGYKTRFISIDVQNNCIYLFLRHWLVIFSFK